MPPIVVIVYLLIAGGWLIFCLTMLTRICIDETTRRRLRTTYLPMSTERPDRIDMRKAEETAARTLSRIVGAKAFKEYQKTQQVWLRRDQKSWFHIGASCVYVTAEDGTLLEYWCIAVHHQYGWLPVADRVLALYLHLRADPRAVRRIANWHYLTTPTRAGRRSAQ